MFCIEVKRAIAIRCWRIMVNGIEIDRRDTKSEATTECNRLRREYGCK